MKATIRKISCEEADYPFLLKQAVSPPKDIYVKGDPVVLKKPAIAIVGTRKATQEGLNFAKEIAGKLAKAGFVIVSGLAYGIDSAAHKGALETEGLTAAVVAHGLNMIYPKIHQNLAAEIIKKGGVIISEYDPETPPYQHQFLERNRIIAGLAIATIVVEAPIHSGSLATARYAAEAGREVFVTPGPHYSKNYEGSHDLIRKGARLVASFEHLKEDLAAIADQNQDINLVEELKEEVAELSAQEKLVLDMIVKMNGKATIDSLAEITKLKPQALSSIITTLILTDKIAEVRGNFVIKK